MLSLWYITAILQCVLLLSLFYGARRILLRHKKQTKAGTATFANTMAEELQQRASDMPTVALIIPAAGQHPNMEMALRSLFTQDYPHIIPILVTESGEDPATALAQRLRREFPALHCLVAGQAEGCSQKNHNLLFALAHVNALTPLADIFVFCDSTHVAEQDFIHRLVTPIIRGEIGMCTGYHEVQSHDCHLATLGYQISVLMMRCLQAIAPFTQPWGGAMAISRTLFETHDFAGIWSKNVVDDCSLAGILEERRVHVHLCPDALLVTTARNHAFSTWQAWLQRQVLFLKFCVMKQWYLLGLLVFLLAFPLMASTTAVCAAVFLGMGSVETTLWAFGHLASLCGIVLLWRSAIRHVAQVLPPVHTWCAAYFLGIGMFFWVYIKSITLWHMDWYGIRYFVAKGGHVVRLEREK